MRSPMRTRRWNGVEDACRCLVSFHPPRAVAVPRWSRSRFVPPEARLSGGKITMRELARTLSMLLGRSVIDKTGIAGVFDVQLAFYPDETTPGMPPPPPDTPVTGVTLATALQQQLGLRLESGRGPVEVIVVDEALRPSAN